MKTIFAQMLFTCQQMKLAGRREGKKKTLATAMRAITPHCLPRGIGIHAKCYLATVAGAFELHGHENPSPA